MSRIAKAAAVLAGTGAVALSGAGMAVADSGAEAIAAHSPGVGSGNVVQVPVHIPINLCGNTVNVIGLINPAFGNQCANIDGGDNGDGGYGS
ncbi:MULTISPECIES: chaplin [Streptomyces]|uniref:Chaplin n=1 Tax=Streptomyces solicathayae TaxID=3081768 RepID=A0ABZ0LSS7_9ACTN|nr:chaplin [Streptomyces sp. HUAS YS2]WOX22395.1 chaplin [Streptomyces sp. HUAS YS2]